LWSRRKGGGEGGVDISAVAKNFEMWRETLRAVPLDTIHFERLCASQTILLLYTHGMSLIIQILVEISLGTSLHNLTSLANLGTQKSV
jgi:hypothetical protein